MSRWLAIFFSFLLIFPLAARAAPMEMTYQVYAGGVHVVEAHLDLTLKPSTYTAKLSAHTRGFLGKLVPWQGSFITTGAAKGLLPREHQSTSTWKGEDDVAVYRYDATGQFKSLKLIKAGKDETPKNIDPKLTQNTIDVLTATLRMMMGAAKTDACQGKADIFDSRRRFTLTYAPQGKDTLKPSRYSFYQGPAMKCTAEVIPAGGAWKKKPRGWLSIQEQGRKKGALPTLWLAKIDDSLPAVPVRIMIKTDYGTLFLHLSTLKTAKKTYTAS